LASSSICFDHERHWKQKSSCFGKQIIVLRRGKPTRLAFMAADRFVLGWVCRLFPSACEALAIIRPETVVRWHRAGFRSYWRWKSASDNSTVSGVTVADQVAWGLIPWKSFGDLLRDPLCRWVSRDIDPDKLPPSQPDNHQNLELHKADGRNYKQIHRGDVRRVVAYEGAPALARGANFANHVPGHRRLRDCKAELEQFALNAWRTPQHILDAHPPNQRPQIRTDWRPTSWIVDLHRQ
jgi:hypothetical protein